MRRRVACIGLLSLLALTGCPEDFGKDGTMDRAAHQDVEDMFRKRCTQEKYEEFCKDPLSKECREVCG